MSDNFKSNFGTVLQIGSGSGTPYSYTDVKGVYLVPPIESEQEKIEVTHNMSENREYIKSDLSDPGDWTITMETSRTEPTHQLLFDMRTTGEVRPVRVTYPDGLAYQFDAQVLSITRADVDPQKPDVIQDEVAFAILGDLEDISDSLLS